MDHTILSKFYIFSGAQKLVPLCVYKGPPLACVLIHINLVQRRHVLFLTFHFSRVSVTHNWIFHMVPCLYLFQIKSSK
jgi:hypothetical protein